MQNPEITFEQSPTDKFMILVHYHSAPVGKIFLSLRDKKWKFALQLQTDNYAIIKDIKTSVFEHIQTLAVPADMKEEA